MADKINFGDARYTVSHDETKAAMTDSMIERVGNVIAARLSIAIATGNLSMQDIARAAIEAMRQPTKAMSDAVTEAHIGVGEHWLNSGDAECVWPVMIDAALNEKAGAVLRSADDQRLPNRPQDI